MSFRIRFYASITLPYVLPVRNYNSYLAKTEIDNDINSAITSHYAEV
jgi:hypothetical protein